MQLLEYSCSLLFAFSSLVSSGNFIEICRHSCKFKPLLTTFESVAPSYSRCLNNQPNTYSRTVDLTVLTDTVVTTWVVSRRSHRWRSWQRLWNKHRALKHWKHSQITFRCVWSSGWSAVNSVSPGHCQAGLWAADPKWVRKNFCALIYCASNVNNSNNMVVITV